jgi:hypothetical protein
LTTDASTLVDRYCDVGRGFIDATAVLGGVSPLAVADCVLNLDSK